MTCRNFLPTLSIRIEFAFDEIGDSTNDKSVYFTCKGRL